MPSKSSLNSDPPPYTLINFPHPKPHPPPKPTRSIIPNEILILIISKLAKPQLAICARTSRLIYAIATPLLYHTTVVDFFEDINPLFTRVVVETRPSWLGGPKVKILVTSGSRAKGKAEQPFVEPKFTIDEPTLPTFDQLTLSPFSSTIIPDRFSFVTYLTLPTHDHKDCSVLPPLRMPLLWELRIHHTSWQHNLDFCQCRHVAPDTAHCTKNPTCICPLISHLRPRRLVIGGEMAGLTGSALGMTKTGFPFPPPWVKELVVFAGSCTGIEIGLKADHFWLAKIPPTVQKLTIVMQPRDSYDRPRWEFRRVAAFEGRIDPDFLWRRLGHALSGSAVQLEMVGIEKIDRDWSELPIKLEEEAVTRALKTALVAKGWKGPDAEARARGIVFVSREKFDGRRSVQGKTGKPSRLRVGHGVDA